jgi:hypothetical protein
MGLSTVFPSNVIVYSSSRYATEQNSGFRHARSRRTVTPPISSRCKLFELHGTRWATYPTFPKQARTSQ